MRRAAILSGMVFLTTASPAAADSVIAEPSCSRPGTLEAPVPGCPVVSALGGRVVWTSYDATAGGFVLMTAAGGTSGRVPVPARTRPFDVDLGRASGGALVATYSRCAGEEDGPSSGCAVYQVGFSPGAVEQPLLSGVTSDEPLQPSRWGRRIAVSRRSGASIARAELCSAAGAPACRALPGGPSGEREQQRGAGAIDLDLDSGRVAINWFWWRNEIVRTHAILVTRIGAKVATTIARVGAGGAGNASVRNPVLDSGYVYYTRGGASCDYGSNPNAIGRYDLSRRRLTEVRSPRLAGLAVDGGVVTYATCSAPPPGAGPWEAAQIVRPDPQPFGRAGDVDPAEAARCPAARSRADWRTQTVAATKWSPWALELAATPSGRAIAMWPARGALEFAVRAAGSRFGAVRQLRAPVEPALDGWVATDGAGHVIAAWRGGTAGNGAVVQVVTGSVTGRFGTLQTLSRDPDAPDLLGVPVTAMAPDAGAVVVWSQPAATTTSFPTLVAAFRPPGAARFSAPVRIADAYYTPVHVAALPGGRAVVVQTDYRGVTTVAEGGPGGFGTPIPVGDAASAGSTPLTFALPAGGEIVARTRGAGEAFVATRVSTEGVTANRGIALATHGDRVALVWSERDVRSEAARIMLAEGRIGERLSAPRALDLRLGRVTEVNAALGKDGALAVAWRISCGAGNGRVLAVARRSRAARLGTPTLVSGRDRAIGAAAVALGPIGRPTVAWTVSSGSGAASRGIVRAAVPNAAQPR